ncbi:MAG: crossover junction endodeoxyribonuclease RuvC [Oscillospiraceae bacterium]|jgi:crossover junction endodeoxyribonuclease RuvC|nr:crossover junction endodeoxyribonuclease RuvC [Oscillospiraceae bacterium]
MRIMGVDPGYATVGFGIVEYANGKFAAAGYGAVTTKADAAFETRLAEIYADLFGIIDKYRPEFMAVERLFFTTNRKTAIDVAQARGIILLAAANKGVEIAEYTPLQVKQAVTGYGKAVKKQVQEMTARILSLSEIPKPDDVADALAVAVCHAHSYNSRISDFKKRRGTRRPFRFETEK